MSLPGSMDKTSTFTDTMTPEKSVREYISKNPFKLSPWVIRDFFGNAENVTEQQLDYSLDILEELEPRFTENHRDLLEELEKWTLMAVPLVRKIPLSVLLQVIEEFQKSTKILQFLPDFPKSPATRLLDYIIPDESLSAEEKTLEYKEITKNTTRLLNYVISWRDEVEKYIEKLETFLAKNADLSEDQKDRIDGFVDKSRKLIPQIDKKIETMQTMETRENEEFERFYQVVVKDAKYKNMEPNVARSQIQTVYYDSDPVVRSIVAGTKTTQEEEDEEVEDEEEVKAKRKRLANGNHSTNFRRTPCVNKTKSFKKPKPNSVDEIENGTVGSPEPSSAKRRISVHFGF